MDDLTIGVPGRDFRPHYNLLLDAHVRMHWTPVYILALVWALHYVARYALVIRARKMAPEMFPTDVLNVSVSDGAPNGSAGTHRGLGAGTTQYAAVGEGAPGIAVISEQQNDSGEVESDVRGRPGRGQRAGGAGAGAAPTVRVTGPAGEHGEMDDDIETTPLLSGGGVNAGLYARGTILDGVFAAIPRVKNATNIAFNMLLFMFASTAIATMAVYAVPKPVHTRPPPPSAFKHNHKTPLFGGSDDNGLFGSSHERTLAMLVLNWTFLGITVLWALCEQLLPGYRSVAMVRRVASSLLFVLLLGNGIAMAVESSHRSSNL